MHLHVYKLTFAGLQKCQKRINISDGNSVHKILIKACNSSRAEASLLYRIVYRESEILFYIQTNKEIDDDIIFSYGFTKLCTIDMKERLSNLSEGDMVRFNLKVFPSKRKVGGTDQHLKSPEDRNHWLISRFEKHGLKMSDKMFIEKNSELNEFCKGKKYTAVMTHEYEGSAMIVDYGSFVALIENGMENNGC